jgi:hypothetical protein
VRKLWIALPAALIVAVWAAGRAPSQFVLEEACRTFHEERRHQELVFRQASEEVGSAVTPQQTDALRKLELLRTKMLHKGAWEVLLIPPGAVRPDPAGFYTAGKYDPSTHEDAPLLRGEMEIWIAPKGWCARCLSGLGVSP